MSVIRRAAAMEAAMWRALFRWALRRPLPLAEGDVPFGYLGVIKPILGVFIGLSIVEIPVLDLIVKNVIPWPPARWIMLAISVWGLLWMAGFIADLRSHPHLVGTAGIRARLGSGTELTLPWAEIESVAKSYRSLPSSKRVQIEQEGERRVLHLVVGAQTAVDVRLRRPSVFPLPAGPSETVHEVRVYADDPDAFVRATRGRLADPAVEAGAGAL